MQILSLLIGVLQFIDQIYKALIGVLWYAAIYYGLNPHYTFLSPFLADKSYISLTHALYYGFYYQFSVIVLLFASVGALILNSFSKPGSSYQILVKWLTAVIIGAVSFFMISWLLSLIGTVYGALFNSVGFNWYNFLNFSSSISFQGISLLGTLALGIWLMKFFSLRGRMAPSLTVPPILPPLNGAEAMLAASRPIPATPENDNPPRNQKRGAFRK